jgi:thiaminase (transcriptional activator TenA)
MSDLAGNDSLYIRLRETCAEDWRAYTEHDFVARLADGSLPEEAFRHYLKQDYLFLIHFARAYALAAYKADDMADMRAAATHVTALLDTEMSLHVDYCAGWGIAEADIHATPESKATMAYTRFVLERGMAGDVLDLYVALAPCVIGYGEIGKRLIGDPATRLDGNPYRKWIEMYGGDDYRAGMKDAIATLDRAAARRETPQRFDGLARTFRQATRLEADFWQMGLTLAG